jgi:hypothetical protein
MTQSGHCRRWSRMAPVAKSIPTASPAMPKFSGNRGRSRFNYDVPLEDRHGAPTPQPARRGGLAFKTCLPPAPLLARTDEVIE